LIDVAGRVKIADFGIARMLGTVNGSGAAGEPAAPENTTQAAVGTPGYSAPEQKADPQRVDSRADIYSLGVVFYELLTGELPLGKFAPPSQKVRVDVRLDSVVLRALEKEPERRYQRASDVKTDVQAITATPPPIPKSQPPPIVGPDISPRPGHGRHWLVVGTGAAALLLLVLALAVPGYFLPPTAHSGRNSVPEQLHYDWKTGAVLTYAVKVATTNENYSETVSGNVIYTVRSVDGDRATISCLSHLGPPLRQSKPGRGLPMSFPHSFGEFWPGPAFGNPARELQVDGTGKILSRSGNAHSLPQALGDVEGLIFEALPAQQTDHWETRGDSEIRETRFVPLTPNSHFGHEEETMLPSRETIQYEIVSRSGTTVVIGKRYELVTDETIAGQPRIKLAGQGTIQFDVVAGLPEAMDFQGTLTEAGENATYRLPLTLSYHRAANATNQPALTAQGNSNAPPAELTAAQIDELLMDLKSTAPGRPQIAAARLAATKPGAPHDAVETQLLAMLASPDWPIRQSAANALSNWGSAKAVESLVKLLDDSVFSVRWAAIESLGRLHDGRAIAPLAKHFAARVDVAQTSTALEQFGAAAEESVIELLASKNSEVRYAACRLLAVIGTKASVPALTTAASDGDGIVALLAKDALKTIEARRQAGTTQLNHH
ncbi:MAG TPA: HEAT repeat domain-containing protein, partial [Verrucomicrobiae bacterium]